MRQVLRLDAVERRQRAAEHVVEAAVLAGALDREQVDRLLDDADDRAVAARVEADRADLLLGEVPALAAEAHALLHLLDRVGERERLRLRHLEEMERKPMRGAAADSGQPRQLRDEVVDGGAQHRRSVAARIGRAVSWAAWPRSLPVLRVAAPFAAPLVVSNWIWLLIVLALIGVIVWGWVWDFGR